MTKFNEVAKRASATPIADAGRRLIAGAKAKGFSIMQEKERLMPNGKGGYFFDMKSGGEIYRVEIDRYLDEE